MTFEFKPAPKHLPFVSLMMARSVYNGERKQAEPFSPLVTWLVENIGELDESDDSSHFWPQGNGWAIHYDPIAKTPTVLTVVIYCEVDDKLLTELVLRFS